MYTHNQKLADPLTQELRKAAGRWLKELREHRGLSQRELAALVGADFYTFISQIETGRGRVPPDSYDLWARALGVDKRTLVKRLMYYYDPLTFRCLFEEGALEVGPPS